MYAIEQSWLKTSFPRHLSLSFAVDRMSVADHKQQQKTTEKKSLIIDVWLFCSVLLSLALNVVGDQS